MNKDAGRVDTYLHLITSKQTMHVYIFAKGKVLCDVGAARDMIMAMSSHSPEPTHTNVETLALFIYIRLERQKARTHFGESNVSNIFHLQLRRETSRCF